MYRHGTPFTCRACGHMFDPLKMSRDRTLKNEYDHIETDCMWSLVYVCPECGDDNSPYFVAVDNLK